MNKSTNITVNFVVAGTQKGGTTALYSYLNEHDNIVMASTKEVHFFDNESYFNNDIDYSIYHSFFKEKNDGELCQKLYGEATPIYMYWNEVPKRIYNYNKYMKFIIILRNPIDRAHSHWNMERERNNDTTSFSDAIYNEKNRCKEALPLQHRIFSYLDRGFYTKQIKQIWKYFPKEQTLILKSEDLKNNPSKVLSEVSKFLKINNFSNMGVRNVHTRDYISKMTQKEHDYLSSIFANEVRELEELLDWDCSDWLKYNKRGE